MEGFLSKMNNIDMKYEQSGYLSRCFYDDLTLLTNIIDDAMNNLEAEEP